ncbi:MAG: glycosyltransferase [Alphaproteobacteria bacterium]|nr:glycosyltransferase [Alphaproteobacteria bacterium]
MSSPRISVILPSLREKSVNSRIQEMAACNPDCDYELLIISPFDVEGPHVVHIKEHVRRGVIYAMNDAYRYAKGHFIVLWSDDAQPTPNCLNAIADFVADKKPPFLASFRKQLSNGKETEQYSIYGRLAPGWLCTTKETIEMVGGLFNPILKNYWADPDLAMRVWDKGGSAEVCREASITILQANDDIKQQNLTASFQKDMDTFFNIWHEKYGDGKPRIWWKINKQIPLDLMGHVREFFREIPYLKQLVDATRSFKHSRTQS